MLLSADFATPHRNAVLAYDAANEIGLGIVIARPTPPRARRPCIKAQSPAAAARQTGPGGRGWLPHRIDAIPRKSPRLAALSTRPAC